MQPGGHRRVHQVIDARDAVEHRADLSRLQLSGLCPSGCAGCERNSTTDLNFCGGRFLNEGIGAVGLTSVRAIPWRGSRPAMCDRSGPGPALPLSPILWQARQPDWATTSLPASYSDSVVPPACSTALGVLNSIAVGEPVCAPS